METNKQQLEMESISNALNYHNLSGYSVRQSYSTDKRKKIGKYFILDDKGTSITGEWDYDQINHFILGYGKAFNKFKN